MERIYPVERFIHVGELCSRGFGICCQAEENRIRIDTDRTIDLLGCSELHKHRQQIVDPGEENEEKCSGVTSGAGARGQNILTAAPEKSLKSFLSSQKNRTLSLQMSDPFFSPLQILLKKFFFSALLTQHLPRFSLFCAPSFACARGRPPSPPLATPLTV